MLMYMCIHYTIPWDYNISVAILAQVRSSTKVTSVLPLPPTSVKHLSGSLGHMNLFMCKVVPWPLDYQISSDRNWLTRKDLLKATAN